MPLKCPQARPLRHAQQPVGMMAFLLEPRHSRGDVEMAFERGGRPGAAGGAVGLAGASRSAAPGEGFSDAGATAHSEHARSWSVELRTGRIVAAPCRQCEEPWESPDDGGA
jgi:hypothetical protein